MVLPTVAGGHSTIVLDRTQLAERAFRLTGGGLYRDALLVGAEIPASVGSQRALLDGPSGSVGQVLHLAPDETVILLTLFLHHY